MSRRADPEPLRWVDRVEWPKAALAALLVVVVFFVGLGIWAIGEGKVPCKDRTGGGGGGGRNASAACFPPDGTSSTVDWLVRPDRGP
jgi:hypothetical protein